MPKYKIPAKLLPPVQKKDLASQMKGLNINKPNLTIRKPADITGDINKELYRVNKKIKGKRMGVNDIMAQLRKMDVKVTEQKTDKKGGKTRRKRRKKKRRKRKKTRRK